MGSGIFNSTMGIADSGVRSAVVFAVGDLACAVPAHLVREILPSSPATRIPGVHPAVLGLVNVRGALLTVVDLHPLLGQRRGPGEDEAIVVLLRGSRGTGLLVSEVLDYVELPQGGRAAPEPLPGVDPRLVAAIGLRGDAHFVVLETESLLEPVLGPAASAAAPDGARAAQPGGGT